MEIATLPIRNLVLPLILSQTLPLLVLSQEKEVENCVSQTSQNYGSKRETQSQKVLPINRRFENLSNLEISISKAVGKEMEGRG